MPGCQTGQAYSRYGRTKDVYNLKEREGGTLYLFRSLRRAIDTLAVWMISLTWISHFKFKEIVTPSNLIEDT